jgi:hypothetical protein
MISRNEYPALKFYKFCKLRRETDPAGIRECVNEAAQDGIMPERVFVEPVPNRPKQRAILYTVPRDEFIEEIEDKVMMGKRLEEEVVDRQYDRFGDEYYQYEKKDRRMMRKWLKKII